MKQHKLGSLIFILLLGLLVGQPAQGRERPEVGTHHSLWKIQGTRTNVYLLGSVHLLKASDYPLPTPIEAAFSNAAVVVFEADIGKMEAPALQLKLLSQARLPEGETLRDRLSTNTYQQFSAQVKAAGLPLAMFDSFKPSMAAITLMLVEIQKLGFDPEYGLDKHFYELARKANKSIQALETPEFQIDLLTGFSKAEDESVMTSTLADLKTIREEFGDIIQAWRTGDVQGLEKLLNGASKEAPAVFKRLLTDRNSRWVPQIEELARGEKPVLVIVGAGHLVGKEGVVELLKKKGFGVSQE